MKLVIIDLLSLLALLFSGRVTSADEKAAIKKLARSMVTNLFLYSGPRGWITRMFLQWVIKKGWIEIASNVETKKKKEAYDKVISDPNASIEDVGNAFHDMLNR